MEFFLIIFIVIPLCSTYSENSFYMGENSDKYLYNITSETHYIIEIDSDNRIMEIRFFFSKKNFTFNPNPFSVVYVEGYYPYEDRGIIETYEDSTKDYYVVYGSHKCKEYSYKKGCTKLKFEIIPIKNISSCIVAFSGINNTSGQGKILFFGIFFICILIPIITILKTNACDNCNKKSEKIDKLQNEPTQPQIDDQSEGPLIQP